MSDTNFSIIVAHDKCLGIGRMNSIPFHFKEDMQHFKTLTVMNIVIMGRKTYESLPIQPLPDRVNIVISKTFQAKQRDVIHVLDFEDALCYSQVHHAQKKIFIIGGEQIYKATLSDSRCTELYITRVSGDFHCDKFFPEYRNMWQLANTILHTDTFSIERYIRF